MNASPEKQKSSEPQLTWYQMIWIAWPFILVGIGGAIGGACGGAALALNLKVFHAVKHPVLRYLWTGFISVAVVAAYFIIARSLLPLFDRPK